MRALTRLRNVYRPVQGLTRYPSGGVSGCGVPGHSFARGSFTEEVPRIGEQMWKHSLFIGLSGVATGGIMALAASALPQGANSFGHAPSWLESFALEPGLKRTVAPGQTPSSNPLLSVLMKQEHLVGLEIVAG